jgi:hypothetical protein
MQKLNYKLAFLLYFGILLDGALFSQEQLAFVAVRDTFAVNANTGETILIQAGETITSNADVLYNQILMQTEPNRFETRFHLAIHFGEQGNSFTVFAKDFLPANTEDIFGNDIFIDFPLEPPEWEITHFNIDSMWVPAYYKDVLIGEDRNILLEMFPSLVYLGDHGWQWYDLPVQIILTSRAMFYNSVIMLGGGIYLAVRNIQRTDFGYIVDCVVSTLGRAVPRRPANWGATGTSIQDTYWFGDTVTLLLYLDGDYLDIYTEGSDIHVGTFIRVGQEFIAQYQRLIRTNTTDLTNVQWPQRAGVVRRPVPPVVEITLPVEIEEELVAVMVEATVIAAIEAPPAAAVENAPATSAMPLWVWLAIGCGAIAVGGAMVAQRRKR